VWQRDRQTDRQTERLGNTQQSLYIRYIRKEREENNERNRKKKRNSERERESDWTEANLDPKCWCAECSIEQNNL
jgi:hypothetical protein